LSPSLPADALSIAQTLLTQAEPHGAQVERVERPGDGNMNHVMRAFRADGTTCIIKQAPPYVAKYPSVAAPEDRLQAEAAYYAALTADEALAAQGPTVLHHLPEAHALLLSDLGPATDLTSAYASGVLSDTHLSALRAYLTRLHRLGAGLQLPAVTQEMKQLNHAHIFHLPFQAEAPRALDEVVPGLEALRVEVLQQPGLVDAIAAWGAYYLEAGDTLLHGDFYPGSWIQTDDGLKVLDAEFAHLGDPAFDHGVLVAHLALIAPNDPRLDPLRKASPEGTSSFAGIEILRRLFGVAQLPLRHDLDVRSQLAQRAAQWILEETESPT